MGTIHTKWPLIVVLLLVLGIFGCGNNAKDEKGIASIELECADLCKTMKTPSFKGENYKFDNVYDLKLFQKAISHAVKIEGEVEYGVMFIMNLYFEDGTKKKMVLNVADEDGRTALLVDTTEGVQSYEIPKDLTAELRKIIYSRR